MSKNRIMWYNEYRDRSPDSLGIIWQNPLSRSTMTGDFCFLEKGVTPKIFFSQYSLDKNDVSCIMKGMIQVWSKP